MSCLSKSKILFFVNVRCVNFSVSLIYSYHILYKIVCWSFAKGESRLRFSIFDEPFMRQMGPWSPAKTPPSPSAGRAQRHQWKKKMKNKKYLLFNINPVFTYVSPLPPSYFRAKSNQFKKEIISSISLQASQESEQISRHNWKFSGFELF